MTRYWKSIINVVGLAVVILTSLDAAWGDAAPDWLPIVAAVATAVGVYAKANTPPLGHPSDPGISEQG